MIKYTKNWLAVIGCLSIIGYLFWFTQYALVEAYNRGRKTGIEETQTARELSKACYAWWFDEANRLKKGPNDVKRKAK